MAQHESKAQKDTIHRVMHEFKHGDLKRGSRGKVRSRRQAVAIALSEAGASNQQSERTNRRRLRDTKRKERAAQSGTGGKRGRGSTKTRDELYAEAKKRGIPGRSAMTKRELQKALTK